MSNRDDRALDDPNFFARMDEFDSIMSDAVEEAIAENKALGLDRRDESLEISTAPRVAED